MRQRRSRRRRRRRRLSPPRRHSTCRLSPSSTSFQPHSDPFTAPPPASFDAGNGFDPNGTRAFGADAFAASAAAQAGAATNESYLSAARRSARAAAAAQAEQAGKSPFAGFSWGFANKAQPAAAQAKSGGATRFLLIGGIALIVLVAMVAGVMLSHSLGTNAAHAPANLPPMFQARPGSTPDGSASPATQSPPATQYVPPATTGSGDDESQAPVNHNPHGRIVTEAPSSPKIAKPVAPAAQTPRPQAQQTPAATPLQRLAALANGGNPKAELLLGLTYLDGQGTPVNEAEAARWLERAASQGEALAQYRLGTLYERGRGVPSDIGKATVLFGAAAKLGNLKAMYNLAVAYAEGNGVKKDPAQAAQWFTRAANLGLSDSQFNLAVLYERGMGVPQSLTDAYKWYAIAATQGDTESKSRIDALATQLSDDDKAAASRAAAAFKPQAAGRARRTIRPISPPCSAADCRLTADATRRDTRATFAESHPSPRVRWKSICPSPRCPSTGWSSWRSARRWGSSPACSASRAGSCSRRS